MKSTRYYSISSFYDIPGLCIRIDAYDNINQLRKSVNNREAFGMWKPYRSPQKHKSVGRIAIAKSASLFVIVHEATHAARYLTDFIDWNKSEEEEEEHIADTVASIVYAILTTIKRERNPLCSS